MAPGVAAARILIELAPPADRLERRLDLRRALTASLAQRDVQRQVAEEDGAFVAQLPESAAMPRPARVPHGDGDACCARSGEKLDARRDGDQRRPPAAA